MESSAYALRTTRFAGSGASRTSRKRACQRYSGMGCESCRGIRACPRARRAARRHLARSKCAKTPRPLAGELGEYPAPVRHAPARDPGPRAGRGSRLAGTARAPASAAVVVITGIAGWRIERPGDCDGRARIPGVASSRAPRGPRRTGLRRPTGRRAGLFVRSDRLRITQGPREGVGGRIGDELLPGIAGAAAENREWQ